MRALRTDNAPVVRRTDPSGTWNAPRGRRSGSAWAGLPVPTRSCGRMRRPMSPTSRPQQAGDLGLTQPSRRWGETKT
eukprot:441838-Prorocentrum_minimum.AAC.2